MVYYLTGYIDSLARMLSFTGRGQQHVHMGKGKKMWQSLWWDGLFFWSPTWSEFLYQHQSSLDGILRILLFFLFNFNILFFSLWNLVLCELFDTGMFKNDSVVIFNCAKQHPITVCPVMEPSPPAFRKWGKSEKYVEGWVYIFVSVWFQCVLKGKLLEYCYIIINWGSILTITYQCDKLSWNQFCARCVFYL